MAGLVELELTGGGRIQADLAKVRLGLTDLRPYWRMLFPEVAGWIRENFATQGKLFDNPWPPLSPDYAAAKLKRWGSRPLLVASGDLRKEVQRPKHIADAKTMTVWIEENLTGHHGPIAAFHQEGTATMPARPLLYVNFPAQLEPRLNEIADRYVADLLRHSSLSP